MSGNYKPVVNYDGANGVGARKMIDFAPYLGDALFVEVCNDGTSGKLNHMVIDYFIT